MRVTIAIAPRRRTRRSEDIEDTFQRIVKEHIDAIDMLVSPHFFRIRSRIAELD